eukprot:gene58120-79598_t
MRSNYIILPDGIGHGASSKPSDGLRARFPAYDYDDMVEAQRRLLVDGLKVDRLRLLNDLEHQIHAYFRDSGKARIDEAPASGVMLNLLNDARILFKRVHPDDRAEVASSLRASARHLTFWRQTYRVALPRR